MAINSYPELVADTEGLLAAHAMHADQLPCSEPLRDGLEAALSNLKAVKAEQEYFELKRQVTTQRLRAAAELTREAARRLRGFVKGALGTKNEQLVHFGIAPIRARRNRLPNPKPPAAAKPAEKPVQPYVKKVA